jgi:transposase InsO family protein
MGSVADAYDNSMAESFVSTLKRELIHRRSRSSRQVLRTAIIGYIEPFYNTGEDTPPWGISAPQSTKKLD